jgi:peptide/nickel transport system substrate-binding protein
LAGAALVGCGDDDDGEPTATSTPTSTPEGSTTTGPQASAAGDASGSSLPDEFIVANEGEPPDLLPWFSNFASGLITRQVYQTLWEPRLTLVDGQPNWEFVPVLAESFEQTSPTTWQFALREGVTFHNGEPWDADAAVASYELLSNQEIITDLQRFDLFRTVAGIRKLDQMTVELEALAPGIDAVATAIRLGFSAVPTSLATGDWESLAENPVGTGPIRITAFDRGSEIRGEFFEGYWGRPFPIPFVKWITRPEASVRALTINSGEAHFAFNIGSESAKQLDHWVAAAGFQTNMIRLNNTRPPFDDVRVRRAANYAINREEIVSAIFNGAADPTSFFAYAPTDAEPFPFDPERARSLLDEAGATGVEIDLVYGELRLPEEPQLAEVFKGYLDAVGFNVTLKRVEREAYSEASAAAFEQQPQMLIESTSSGNYGEMLGALNDKFGCEGSGTFCNEDLEAQWSALATESVEERNAGVAAIARTLQEEYAPRVFVAAAKQVHGLAPFVDPSALPTNLYVLFDDLRFA